jgi:hypothetical protein
MPRTEAGGDPFFLGNRNWFGCGLNRLGLPTQDQVKQVASEDT